MVLVLERGEREEFKEGTQLKEKLSAAGVQGGGETSWGQKKKFGQRKRGRGCSLIGLWGGGEITTTKEGGGSFPRRIRRNSYMYRGGDGKHVLVEGGLTTKNFKEESSCEHSERKRRYTRGAPMTLPKGESSLFFRGTAWR